MSEGQPIGPETMIEEWDN